MITVIIPVYNVEKYLETCLNSIINQTSKDLEIICINDGSTDNSLKILEKYQSLDKRIFIYSQKNSGQGFARNKALNIAKGEFICFVDPDDWLEEDAILSAYTIAKENNAQVVQFNYKTFIEKDESLNEHNFAEQIFNLYNYNLNIEKKYNYKNVLKDCLHAFDMHIVNKLYSSDFIRKNRIRFSKGKYAEDWLFAIMTLLMADEIHYLNKYNYIYRIRKTSSSNKKSLKVFDLFKIFEEIEKFLKEENFYNNLQEQFFNFKLQLIFWGYKIVPFYLKWFFILFCLSYLDRKRIIKLLYFLLTKILGMKFKFKF